METIEMIRWVCYATSLIVCAVLAVYFLRAFLTKRLRAFLWWATGFSLFALGVLVMTVAVYGFHRILVMLAFAVVAASVAFLYYAASWRFLNGESFYKEKFTVILFLAFLVLFLLSVYLFPEEHIAEIIESPTMILFTVAFLVIAVLFNQFVERLFGKYHCKRVVALQSLAWWIIAVWGLYIALFWGSVVAVGLVFVLSSLGFMLLLYGCKGGDNMSGEDIEDDAILCKGTIDIVKNAIEKGAIAPQGELGCATVKISNALYGVSKGDLTKKKMVSRAGTIGERASSLVTKVVELAENTLMLAKTAYGNPDQLDEYDRIPLCRTCEDMGDYSGNFFSEVSECATEIKELAKLADTNASADLIDICCKLVKRASNLGRNAVTENEWEHKDIPLGYLRGMIGHAYDILRECDEKTKETAYAVGFECYLEEANNYLVDALALWDVADEAGSSPTKTNADQAATYLNEAIDLLDVALDLVERASDYIGGLTGP